VSLGFHFLRRAPMPCDNSYCICMLFSCWSALCQFNSQSQPNNPKEVGVNFVALYTYDNWIWSFKNGCRFPQSNWAFSCYNLIRMKALSHLISCDLDLLSNTNVGLNKNKWKVQDRGPKPRKSVNEPSLHLPHMHWYPTEFKIFVRCGSHVGFAANGTS
jgi:hypothetical protein